MRLFTVALFCSITAFAAGQDSPSFGEAQFTGSGCRPGTGSVAVSPDGQTFSILFDEYRVEAGNGTRVEIKNCEITLPISVQGKRTLRLVKADYRGFNSLPKESTSEFAAQYNFDVSPDHHPGRKRKFKGPLNEEFMDTDLMLVRARCVSEAKLRIRTQLTVNSNAQQDRAFSQVDTTDVVSGRRRRDRIMKFELRVKACDARD